MNIRKLPIPVGYPEWPRAVLPAHQGYMKEGVSWKIPQGWGNNWFSNWTDVNGCVWWDIDVVQKGRFQVTLKYTVPKNDVGARVRIEAGKDSIEGRVDKAHDPDYIPSPDRYPRVEAYEKEWAFLDLGVIEMMKGRTQFKVKALSKPGDQVIELKDVILTRID
jgi:arylsulfatase A